MQKNKKFCKWLIANKDEIAANSYYISTIMFGYKTGKPLKNIEMLERFKKNLAHDSELQQIKELFRYDLGRFFSYLEKQRSDPFTYLDYLKACEFLGLDMSADKNRFPHDFKRWHDVRIDEYATAKALADERERAKLYAKFEDIAQKYAALQGCKKGDFAVIIATSPAELMREGEALKHCVGRMGYDQKMVREETLIFFVRAKEQPDTPFVTVEYSPKSKKVLQCYGQDSKRPDEGVIEFVNKVWLPFANRKLNKINKKQAA